MSEHEITASGKSSLTHYIENVLREIDGIKDATQGIFHEPGVISLGGLVEHYGDCHGQWFRLARQEMIDSGAITQDRELLADSLDKHDVFLATAFKYSQQDATRQEVDLSLSESWEAVTRLVRRTESLSDSPAGATCYVTFPQMAAIVNRKERTIRRLYDKGILPAPAVQGGKGAPHEWRWEDVRPILEKQYKRPLPEVFPADQFVRS